MIINPLKVWVQNVLPVVYDDSLSYLEVVAQINAKTNEIISQTNENTNAIETLAETIAELGDIEELRALLDEVETIVDDLYTTDLPLMDGTASAGSANHAARSDHVHPSDTNRAPVNHASGETTYGIGDTNNYGHVKLTDNINNTNTGTALTPSAVKNFAKPNLLDNWYFVGGGSQQGDGQFPINQRSQASYPNTGYCIDRWDSVAQNSGGIVSVENDCLKITSTGTISRYITQKMSNGSSLNGKTITFSLLCKSITGTWQFQFSGGSIPISQGLVTATITNFNYSTENFLAKIFPTSEGNIEIIAVKAELGSEQTLAHNEGIAQNPNWVLNEIPDYGQELAKCQRYCIVYKTNSNSRSFLALGYAASTSQYRAVLPTPVTMNHSTNRRVELTGTMTAGALTASSVSSFWEENPGSITLFVNVTGATFGNVTWIILEASSTLIISADL